MVYFFKKYSKRGNLNNIQGLNNVQSPNAENFVQFEAKMTILWHFFYFFGSKGVLQLYPHFTRLLISANFTAVRPKILRHFLRYRHEWNTKTITTKFRRSWQRAFSQFFNVTSKKKNLKCKIIAKNHDKLTSVRICPCKKIEDRNWKKNSLSRPKKPFNQKKIHNKNRISLTDFPEKLGRTNPIFTHFSGHLGFQDGRRGSKKFFFAIFQLSSSRPFSWYQICKENPVFLKKSL